MIVPNEREAIPPEGIKASKVLVVEGNTPAHFFEALAKSLGLSESVEIRNFGGITQLGTFLKVLVRMPEFNTKVSSLAVVRDGENNPRAALEAAQGAVRAAGVGSNIKVAYYILPDNDGRTPGMIETICVRSIASRPGYACIDQFFACVREAGVSMPTDIRLAKHQIQVYLATQAEVQMMPGIAAYRDAFPLGDAVFSGLAAFLK